MPASPLSVIGIMSGSSMDGLDMALCKFYFHNKKIKYQLIKATTISYPKNILQLLSTIRTISAELFFEKDAKYGQWIAQVLLNWMKKNHLNADLIAIHGHTVFHYPHKGFSVQLGNPAQIAAKIGKPVVHNFRNLDIAFQGQGAPLVPIGDKLLFSDYDACVNIGGIANIFVQKTSTAYDICIANLALNYFAQKLNKKYDKNGTIAKKGTVHNLMLNQLNQLPFIQQKPPKSLNREYFENTYLPIIQKHSLSIPDTLATLTEHIATQISQSIHYKSIQKVLITGGGAFNQYLVSRIKYLSPQKNIIIPDKEIVKFKEAIIFALLGYLRYLHLPNTIPTATGSIKATSSGEIFYV